MPFDLNFSINSVIGTKFRELTANFDHNVTLLRDNGILVDADHPSIGSAQSVYAAACDANLDHLVTCETIVTGMGMTMYIQNGHFVGTKRSGFMLFAESPTILDRKPPLCLAKPHDVFEYGTDVLGALLLAFDEIPNEGGTRSTLELGLKLRDGVDAQKLLREAHPIWIHPNINATDAEIIYQKIFSDRLRLVSEST